MRWIVELQHWLYTSMAGGFKSAEQITALPALLASAVLFGALHALMPGHGKSVLVSYHLGRSSRVWDGLLTALVLAVTHIGSAVLFVMLGVAVISRSFVAGGRAPAFETTSAILIICAGAFLLWRSVRPHVHTYGGDGKALAFFTGLIPCPLTTFILTYAIVKHQLAVGFATVAAMALGVIATLSLFAIAAVLARGRLMALLGRTEALRERLGQIMEVGRACAIIVLGITMLIAT